MDVGIYSLNACRYLTGEEPALLSATCSVIDKDGRFKDVEENVSWAMKFPLASWPAATRPTARKWKASTASTDRKCPASRRRVCL